MRTPSSILALFFSAVLLTSSGAGPLEDGTQAFEKNDWIPAMILLQPLADRGNARAQFMVGAMHFRGWGVAEDFEAGLAWIRKAADQGDAEAQSLLGDAYLEGRGTKLDHAEAMKWFLKAADQGDSSAQRSIAEMYAKGLGVAKSQAKAKTWYEKSRRQPQLPAEVLEGLASSSAIVLYSLQPWGGPGLPQWDFHGHHVLGRMNLSPKQAKTAVTALNTALSTGDANFLPACMITPRHALAFKIGGDAYDILICYQCGQLELRKNDQYLPFTGMIGGTPAVLNGLLKSAGVPPADNSSPITEDSVALQKSYAEEAKVALKLAEEGDAQAQRVLATMFMRGRGLKKDETKGIDWLRKSLGFAPDHPDFQVMIGKIYADDQHRKYSKAMELFKKAAAQGNLEAQHEIAGLYEFGQGVAKDPAEAMKWFRQAAENGYAEAQFTIGVRHAQGRDAKQDHAEALRWLRKAADQSHPEALNWMGTMYEEGWGVPKDQMEAYFWDRLAVKYHTTYGNRVAFRATAEQFALVEKRIADWIATHPKAPAESP
ncbi:MAG: tetratricopeptide repeat protein [Chthoniobacterales bacterium]